MSDYLFKPNLWVTRKGRIELDYTHSTIPFQDSLKINKKAHVGMSLVLGVELNKLRFELDFIDHLYDFRKFSGRFLNFMYLENPFKNKKIFLGVGIKYGILKHREKIRTLRFQKEMKIGNKSFDSGSVDVLFEQRSIVISPSIYLMYSINNRMKLQVEGTCLLNLNDKNGLYIKENDSFLRTKRIFTTADLIINNNNPVNNLINKSMFISFGLKMDF